MTTPIGLVCFDLGGVMLRICRSWSEGCVAAGVDVRGDVDALVAQAKDGADWEAINGPYQCGDFDADEFARRFSALLSGLYSPTEVLAVHRAWIHGEYDGIGDVIATLHDHGVGTAVLSNSCAEHWKEMPGYPAVQAVQTLLGSHEIAMRKPDVEAYREVERRTGHHPRGILFFDDLPENVAAAQLAGWRAERVDHAQPTTVVQIMRVLGEHGVL